MLRIMAATASQSLQILPWIDSEKNMRKPNYSLRLTQRCREQQRLQMLISRSLQPIKAVTCHRPVTLKVSCSPQNCQALVLESETFPASFDEAVILKTEVLQKLSSMQRLVVSTGGGAVIRPINWKHMRRGISIWLDVPLEALAQRITAMGTDSRPLLHNESGDAYTKTFRCLCTLWEERSEAYTNANARVSLDSTCTNTEFFEEIGFHCSPSSLNAT